jgi:hypothetical protein
MISALDIRDWLVIVLVAFIMTVSTVFLFLYHSPIVFGTWAGVVSTVQVMYHWIVFKDSKVKDNSQ